MSVRSERIKALVEQSGYSYQELEQITGVKKSSLQRYANGTTSKIPLDAIEALSVAFSVPQQYLMGWDDEKENLGEISLTEGEKDLIKLFRLIPEDQQKVFLGMVRSYANSLKAE